MDFRGFSTENRESEGIENFNIEMELAAPFHGERVSTGGAWLGILCRIRDRSAARLVKVLAGAQRYSEA